MQAYGTELVQDTLIELTIGRRYGLIGPNGCGKSSFLKCLAYREVNKTAPCFQHVAYSLQITSTISAPRSTLLYAHIGAYSRAH